MPFLSTALGIGAIASAAGGIASSAVGAHAAGSAADAQTAAANHAADLQAQEAANSLAFQQQVYQQSQANSKPFLQAGQNAVVNLNSLLGMPAVSNPVTAQTNTQAPTPTAPFQSNGPAQGVLPQRQNPRMIINPRLQGLAKGGTAKAGRYLVGEKGPEVLVMHPGSSGTVIPNNRVKLSDLVPRANGGLVQGGIPNTGGNVFGVSSGSPIPNTGAAPPGQYGYSPYQAQRNNPLVTGGSPTPIQNTPFTQWSQQFNAPGGAPGTFNAPGGAPGQFQAPTFAQAQNNPGYQFALQQGENALLNNASALGTTGSGATGAALLNYGQQMGAQNYQNVFNQNLAANQQQQANYAAQFGQALNTNQQQQADYQNAYNRAFGQYQNNYNIFNQNQAGQFNRLASVAGLGQTTAGQLNAAGQSAAGNVGNINQAAGQQIGQNINNAGAATASGYVGQANAINQGIGSLSSLAYLPYLQQQQQQINASAYNPQWLA